MANLPKSFWKPNSCCCFSWFLCGSDSSRNCQSSWAEFPREYQAASPQAVPVNLLYLKDCWDFSESVFPRAPNVSFSDSDSLRLLHLSWPLLVAAFNHSDTEQRCVLEVFAPWHKSWHLLYFLCQIDLFEWINVRQKFRFLTKQTVKYISAQNISI